MDEFFETVVPEEVVEVVAEAVDVMTVDSDECSNAIFCFSATISSGDGTSKRNTAAILARDLDDAITDFEEEDRLFEELRFCW